METSILESLSKAIYNDVLTLAYAGRFSDSLTDKIIGLAEVYLESSLEFNNLRHKTGFLVAECFQNVVRHSTTDPQHNQNPAGNESFLIRFYDCKVFIASMNTLPNRDVNDLKKKLDSVNQYNRKELKALYMESLKKGEMSEKGGAGLGLIEMARKTGNKLHYSFMSIDEHNSAFYLMLVLEPEKGRAGFTDYSAELIQNEFIINSLRSENYFLLYHGDFEQDLIGPVAEMIENNLDALEGPLASKIKFYHAAMETIKNISVLSQYDDDRKAGTLSMGKSEVGYSLNTLNPVSKDTMMELKGLLEQLKGLLPSDEVHTVREQVKTGLLPLTADAAQGLIDLARVGKKWSYSFETFGSLPLQFVYKWYI